MRYIYKTNWAKQFIFGQHIIKELFTMFIKRNKLIKEETFFDGKNKISTEPEFVVSFMYSSKMIQQFGFPQTKD